MSRIGGGGGGGGGVALTTDRCISLKIISVLRFLMPPLTRNASLNDEAMLKEEARKVEHRSCAKMAL